MKRKNVYFVILAGGSGERLWPLSKQKKPKQLLKIGNKTLLEQAIDRVRPLAYLQKNIWVSTTKKHEKMVCDLVEQQVGNIIVEPGVRDTGPAILYTCLKLQKDHPNAIVIFLPADPYIPVHDQATFTNALTHVIEFSQMHDDIALIGISPTYPATGYGYIEFTDIIDKRTGLHKVKTFHEKPSQAVASYYMHVDNMLWNSSIFLRQGKSFS